jgi:adenylate kinase
VADADNRSLKMKKVPVIIFLGAPGVGKGTQAAYLSRRKGIPKISTGDMLRHAVQHDSPLGRKVKEIMYDGRLVDDETMLVLVQHRLEQPDTENGFILDGYPRTIKQALQLKKVLKPNMALNAFDIEVPEEEVVKRVAGRRTCPECQRIYNVHFHPPKNNEKCDQDNVELFRRKDDEESVVRKRIATYKKETYPLIDHYRKEGVLNVVNGAQPEEQLAQVITDLLEKEKNT